MRHLLLILFIILFSSCESGTELDGRWIVLEITHNGNTIYPKTISNIARLTLDVVGYEGSEKIDFNTIDSSTTFPGFNSSEIEASFSVSKNKIIFKLIENFPFPDTTKLTDFTKEVFLQEFEIITFPRKENIGFKSKKTFIKLVDESYLVDQRIKQIIP